MASGPGRPRGALQPRPGTSRPWPRRTPRLPRPVRRPLRGEARSPAASASPVTRACGCWPRCIDRAGDPGRLRDRRRRRQRRLRGTARAGPDARQPPGPARVPGPGRRPRLRGRGPASRATDFSGPVRSLAIWFPNSTLLLEVIRVPTYAYRCTARSLRPRRPRGRPCPRRPARSAADRTAGLRRPALPHLDPALAGPRPSTPAPTHPAVASRPPGPTFRRRRPPDPRHARLPRP